MEIRELNESDLESLIKLYEQLDGRNGDFAVEDARTIWKNEIEGNPNIKYFGAVEFAREKNCYKVILESGAWRTEAHQFYRNLGFDDGAKKSFLMKLKDY